MKVADDVADTAKAADNAQTVANTVENADNAIDVARGARKANTITKEQEQMLYNGHWKDGK